MFYRRTEFVFTVGTWETAATIQLDVSFCGRIGVGDFVCTHAVIKSMSGSLTFAQGELRVGERTVATMQGVFKVIR